MSHINRSLTIQRHTYSLQGLSVVPWGAYWLIVAGVHALPSQARWLGVLFAILSLPFVLWFSQRIRNYYQNTFGFRQALPYSKWHIAVIVVAIVATLAAVTIFPLPPHIASQQLPLLLLAITLLVYWWSLERIAIHYLILSLFLAGLGLLPARAYLEGHPVIADVGLYLLLGIMLIVSGICDHLLLIRLTATLTKQEKASSQTVD